MEINFILNGKRRIEDIKPDTILLDLLRKLGCYSVKRGCDSSNCGICTVFVDDRPVLSCRVLAASIDSHNITTLEGLQDEAEEFGAFIADQGAEQCGFCNPGFMMNAMALLRDNPDPSDDDIREYLSGNLCRCSGYESQMRGIKAYVAYKKEAKDE
ncbi:MAG: (2Fe-2S)-binding protein [Lachnospiraceae bacterium]|nr:(2Fe-2S)-binding protein [Lachnospiraceae bacterium]